MAPNPKYDVRKDSVNESGPKKKTKKKQKKQCQIKLHGAAVV